MTHCKFCMLALPDASAGICPHCGKDLTAPQPEHHLPPGTVIGGKIELGAALGEGGFGITYIGRDQKLNLRVAVKEYYPYGFVNRKAADSTVVSCSANAEKLAFFEKGRARFLQEAQTLARFSGEPGIVDVRDFFEENNTAYIVMEYLEGETLRDYLKQRGRLSPEETLRLLTPVMRSLSRLHKENLIHRDVSPDNIMLAKNGVKLLDFGAARLVEGDQKSLSVMLKPGYAPEEQYRSHGQQGPWTDVYALSATMYRCITGVRPDEASERMYEDRLQPPSTLGVAIAPGFETALMRGLAVRANERWQTVDDLLSALYRSPAQQAAAAAPDPRPAAAPTSFDEQRTVPAPPASASAGLLPQTSPAGNGAAVPAQPKQPAGKKKKRAVAIIAAVCLIVISISCIQGFHDLISIREKKRSEGSTATRKSATATENATTAAANEPAAQVDYSGWEIVTFGKYEQSSHAYKEDIEWLVLTREGNRALVISKYALDCMPYNDEYRQAITYYDCSLRTWLNNGFYNAAFSDSEKSRIQNVTVKAEANPNSSVDPGKDTTDRIFLLSINEAYAYLSSDEVRRCEPTMNAVINGAEKNSDGFCRWWLRSPGGHSENAALVGQSGWVNTLGEYAAVTGGSNCAVRPAMWIEMD